MDDVDVGSVLVVPFGRRRVVGVVVGLAERSELPEARLAEPIEALEAGVPPELVELGLWVGEEYCSTPAAGLGLVLPPGVGTGAEARRVRPLVELEVEATAEGLEAVSGGARLGLRQRAVLRALVAGPGLARRLAATAGSDRATLRRLESRGLVTTREVERGAVTTRLGSAPCARASELTPDQRAALGSVVSPCPATGAAGGRLAICSTASPARARPRSTSRRSRRRWRGAGARSSSSPRSA